MPFTPHKAYWEETPVSIGTVPPGKSYEIECRRKVRDRREEVFILAIVVEEWQEITEVFAVAEKWETSPALRCLVCKKALPKFAFIYPEERDDAAFVLGDDHGKQSEIVLIKVADWPEDTPFLALIEYKRTKRKALCIGVEEWPEDRGPVFICIADWPEIYGIAAGAVAQRRQIEEALG